MPKQVRHDNQYMFNHAPKDYKCPVCLGIKKIDSVDTLIRPSDIIYQDNLVTVLINSFFISNNAGHVIIVPNEHIENIFDLPDNLAEHITKLSKKVTIALKEVYKCEGVTLLQNNEPAGDQHAFHYHLHVIPRYDKDNLSQNLTNNKATTPEERLPYAEKLKKYLDAETSLV